MRSFRQFALLALPLLARAFADEPALPSPTKGQLDSALKAFYANANSAFQDLLNSLPEESLHVALNSLTRFRDGVFESDRRGVEHIHSDNPPLATRLIVAAVQDLKKRQQPAPSSNNATTSTTTPSTPPPSSTETPPSSTQAPPSSSQPPATSAVPSPSSSQAPPVIIPVPVETTTDSQGRTSIMTSMILSSPTASIAVPITTTNAQGAPVVSTLTKPAVIFSTTDAAGKPIMTTSPVDFAPTKGQVLTRTNAEGSTFLTTYTPGAGRVSSIVLITTTGADGRQMVVTSYTYVDPAGATGTEAGGAGSTAKPSLQRGGGVARYRGGCGFDAAAALGVGGAALAWFV